MQNSKYPSSMIQTRTEPTFYTKENPLTKALPFSCTQEVQNSCFTLIALNQ